MGQLSLARGKDRQARQSRRFFFLVVVVVVVVCLFQEECLTGTMACGTTGEFFFFSFGAVKALASSPPAYPNLSEWDRID